MTIPAVYRYFVITLLAAPLLACATTSSTTPAAVAPVYLVPDSMKGLNLPFSDAVRAGDLLFLSGKLGRAPGTVDLVPGGIAAETRQTMENIKRSVETWGSRMDHVVKCTVFLADMAEWAAMNDVYKTYFVNPPARSAIASNGLALNARVEIECIAVMPAGAQL